MNGHVASFAPIPLPWLTLHATLISRPPCAELAARARLPDCDFVMCAPPAPRAAQPVSSLPPRDETCPVSTGGGTRRVHSVREGRGPRAPDPAAARAGILPTGRPETTGRGARPARRPRGSPSSRQTTLPAPTCCSPLGAPRRPAPARPGRAPVCTRACCPVARRAAALAAAVLQQPSGSGDGW